MIPRFSFVSWMLLICLAPFFIIGMAGLIRTGAAVQELHAAEGTVTGNVSQLFADGTAAYVPKIRFKTLPGKDAFFTGNTGALPAVYIKGDKVGVLYDPMKPQAARISSFRELWMQDVCFAGISLLLFLMLHLVLPKELFR